MSKPLVVLAFCVYNRRELIDRQLRYLQSQGLAELPVRFEIIIYDDASIPALLGEGEGFECGDIPVLAIRGSVNLGLIEARNCLVKSCRDRADYIWFLDDDIFVYNMAGAIDYFLASVGKGFSAISVPYINLPLEYRGKLSWFKYIYDFRKSSDDVVFFNGGTTFFSMNVFRSIGLLEGRYRMYLEEEDFALRMFVAGLRIRYASNCSFVCLHDQPTGKTSRPRHVFLLSNRLVFHWKFVSLAPLRWLLNGLYVALYLFKSRDLAVIREALSRAGSICELVDRKLLSFSVLRKFALRRFLNW